MNTTWSTTPGQELSRRRSHRVLLNIPVTVSCETPPNMFTEKTQTLVVNVHGALITLEAKATQGQTLVIHSIASETRPCRIVYVGPTVQGRTQYGIEFTEPAPNFWHVSFPRDEWTGTPGSDPVELKKK